MKSPDTIEVSRTALMSLLCSYGSKRVMREVQALQTAANGGGFDDVLMSNEREAYGDGEKDYYVD